MNHSIRHAKNLINGARPYFQNFKQHVYSSGTSPNTVGFFSFLLKCFIITCIILGFFIIAVGPFGQLSSRNNEEEERIEEIGEVFNQTIVEVQVTCFPFDYIRQASTLQSLVWSQRVGL